MPRIFMPSDIQIAPFEILKIYINITLHVSHFVEFHQNEKYKNVLFSIPPTQPPWHNFEYIIVQNMTSSQVDWSKNDEIEQLSILTLSEDQPQPTTRPEFQEDLSLKGTPRSR